MKLLESNIELEPIIPTYAKVILSFLGLVCIITLSVYNKKNRIDRWNTIGIIGMQY